MKRAQPARRGAAHGHAHGHAGGDLRRGGAVAAVAQHRSRSRRTRARAVGLDADRRARLGAADPARGRAKQRLPTTWASPGPCRCRKPGCPAFWRPTATTARRTGPEVLERLPVGPDHRPAVAAERQQPAGSERQTVAERTARVSHACSRCSACRRRNSTRMAENLRFAVGHQRRQPSGAMAPLRAAAGGTAGMAGPVRRKPWRLFSPTSPCCRRRTAVNLNTASAEVIYAAATSSAWPTPSMLVAARERSALQDRERRLQAAAERRARHGPGASAEVGVASSFFEVRARLQAGQAGGRGAVRARNGGRRACRVTTLDRERGIVDPRRCPRPQPGDEPRNLPTIQHPMSALIVFLPAQPHRCGDRVRVRADAGTAAPWKPTAAPRPRCCPQPTRAGTEVVAVVPAAMLSWHRVELPKGTSRGIAPVARRARGPAGRPAAGRTGHPALRAAAPGQAGGAAVGGGLRSRLAAQRRAGAGSAPDARLPASCRSSRPRARRRCTRWAIRKHAALVLAGSDGRDAPAAFFAGAGAAARAARGHAVRGRAGGGALAEQVLHRPPVLQQAPSAGCRRPSPPGTWRSSNSPAPAAPAHSRSSARHGPTCWRRRSGGRRAGARCCWWRSISSG